MSNSLSDLRSTHIYLNHASPDGKYFMNGEGKRRATLRHELCENNFFFWKNDTSFLNINHYFPLWIAVYLYTCMHFFPSFLLLKKKKAWWIKCKKKKRKRGKSEEKKKATISIWIIYIEFYLFTFLLNSSIRIIFWMKIWIFDFSNRKKRRLY